jgi:hypothetical protein
MDGSLGKAGEGAGMEGPGWQQREAKATKTSRVEREESGIEFEEQKSPSVAQFLCPHSSQFPVAAFHCQL